MSRNPEVMITIPASEHQRQAQVLRALYDTADKMLFISQRGFAGTVRRTAWSQLRAALDQTKPLLGEGAQK